MRDLTEARREFDWLRAGSTVVQQGALRDLDRAFTNSSPAGADTRRSRNGPVPGRDSSVRDLTVRRINRKWGEILVSKAGWVRFRISRAWTDIRAATSARIALANDRWTVDGEPDNAAGTAPPSIHHRSDGGGGDRSGCGEFDRHERRPDVPCSRRPCGGTGAVRGAATPSVPAAEGIGEPGTHESEVGAVAVASGRSAGRVDRTDDHRNRGNLFGGGPAPEDPINAKCQAWIAEFSRAVAPYSNGAYTNVPNADMADWQTAYWGSNVDRLRTIKAKYDHDNVFRFEQSIPPAPSR